jgi:multidrug efflux system membrane fusion protein
MPHSHTTSRHRLRRAGIALAVALLAGGGYIYSQAGTKGAAPAAAAPAPAMPVSVATVLERRVTEWDDFSGRLEAVEHVEVRPRVAGYIESVHFAPGSVVEKGATLFMIDSRPFAAELARAEASLAAAQARLGLASSELARARRLLDDQAIAQREFEQRQHAVGDAQASLQSAQASVEIARLNLGYTRITAPISGRVGRAEVTVGNLVGAGAGGAALTSIVSASPIYATFEADEQAYLRYTRSMSANRAARVAVHLGLADEAGYPRQGWIESIDNQLNPQSGTVRVRALFDNRDGQLAPGLFARLRVGGSGERAALLIDERAVGTDQSKKFVWVVGTGNQIAYREVQLGPVVDGLRVVRDGLKPGESIVVNGMQRVRPGMSVAPTEIHMDAKLRAPAMPLAQGKTAAAS